MKSFTAAESSEDYFSLFKELFCVAAQDLATLIQQPLEDIGVLFEGIMHTGTVRKGARRCNFFKFTTRNNLDDSLEDHIEAAEKGRANIGFGRGQLLFVVRRVTRANSTHIQALGYRFASIANVIETLARSMQVTKEELLPYLETLQKHAEKERILEPGVHVACFALRPLVHRGFEVAVRQDARNLLPTCSLALSQLERPHTDILNHMDNWTVDMCCNWLHYKSLSSNENEPQFYRHLLECITELAQQIKQPFFNEARLIARPFKIPCRVPGASHVLDYAHVITFRTIVDAHQYTSINKTFLFTPSRFFVCQQHVYRNSPGHAAFAGTIHRELAALAQNIDRKDVQSGNSSLRKSSQCLPDVHLDFMQLEIPSPSTIKGFSFPGRPSYSLGRRQGKWFDKRAIMVASPNFYFGGIHVSNEISIDITEAEREVISPDIELASLGVRTEAGVADLEPETFADQLMALTIAERRHTRSEHAYGLD